MDRYFIEPYTQRKSKSRPDPGIRYALYDRRGNGAPIAKTLDPDDAQRIVALLNADEAQKKGTTK